jgi:hypothetical protein
MSETNQNNDDLKISTLQKNTWPVRATGTGAG